VASDWQAIKKLRNHELCQKYVRREIASSEEIQNKISTWIKNIGNSSIYFWVITHTENKNILGTICFWNLSEDRLTAEIGYELHPEYWSHGYMSEAKKAVLAVGFTDLGFKNIEAHTHQENFASQKLLEKNGFYLDEGRKEKDFPENLIFIKEKP